jgi:hypothetical protein
MQSLATMIVSALVAKIKVVHSARRAPTVRWSTTDRTINVNVMPMAEGNRAAKTSCRPKTHIAAA